MILMSQGNSEGERRCDARCYNAEGPDCDCCCGGANHGIGLKQAKANMGSVLEGWAEKDDRVKEALDKIWAEINQGELF